MMEFFTEQSLFIQMSVGITGTVLIAIIAEVIYSKLGKGPAKETSEKAATKPWEKAA